GPVPGSEAGEKNGRERVECGPGRGDGPDAEVRRLPQESPRTRGSRRDRARKNPNRERLGFSLLVEAASIPLAFNLVAASLIVLIISICCGDFSSVRCLATFQFVAPNVSILWRVGWRVDGLASSCDRNSLET